MMISSSGSRSTARSSASPNSGETTTGTSPDLVALFRKMSPNLGETTARNPESVRAQTACSRDEPMPKLGPVTRMLAPANSGRLSTKSGSVSRQAEKQPTPNPVRSTRFSHEAGMIWSVSTSLRSNGAAVPRITLIGSIALPQFSRRRERSSDRRSGRHGRRDKMRPPTRPLPAFEIPVRRRGASLARSQLVRIHTQAHRATGGTPFEPSVFEDEVQTLGLRLGAHAHRAGYDHRPHSRLHLASCYDICRETQILNPTVRA